MLNSIIPVRILFFAALCCLFSASIYSQTDSIKLEGADNYYRRLKADLKFAKSVADSSLIAKRLIEFGDFYRQNEAVNQALLHYQNAIKYLSEKDTALVYIHLNSGIIQLRLRSYQTALDYFKRGQQLAQSMDFNRGEAMCSGYIGSCYEKLGQFDKAIDFQNNSLQTFKKLADSTGLALANENLGSVYEDLGQYTLAKSYFETALSYLQTKPKTDLYLNIRNNIADIYRKTGAFEKALDLSEKTLEMALDLKNEHQIESAYKDVAKTLYGLESYQSAYLNLELSDSINEVILQNQNRQQLTALQSLYDAKTKNARIELLLKENEISAAQNRVLWLGLMLLFTVAGGIYWNQRSVKKHQLSLAKYKNKALEAELNAERLEQQSMEREIRLKTNSLSNYSLNLAQKNKTLSTVAHTLSNIKGRKRLDVDSKLSELVDDINKEVSETKEWNQFMEYFGQIHPEFMKQVQHCALSKLSASELRLCMLLKLNMSSKEIAAVLKVTPDSIRVARYRLRKKLPIQKGGNLSDFLFDFS